MWRNMGRSLLWKAKVFNAVIFRSNGSCCGVSAKKWTRPSGFDTGLKTFNSLTKQKEPLILAREGVATWYGMTLVKWLITLHSFHNCIITLHRCPVRVSGTAVDPPCTTMPTWVMHGNNINTVPCPVQAEVCSMSLS